MTVALPSTGSISTHERPLRTETPVTPDMASLFGGTYAGRRVLVTGHTGFKGSWLVLWLQSMGAEVSALALPSDTTPNHYQLLGLSIDEATVDIRNREHVRQAIQAFAPEIVFHLAAQALVKRSYAEPAATFDINVIGLVNVLEAVRVTPSVRAVVNVTSDKCYRQPAPGDERIGAAFTELDALGGHDPYSASKACAEIVSESYRASFFTSANHGEHAVAFATARAGNVIGGGDWSANRLVPDLVRAASEGRAVLIRNPQAVRPWQHVLEPLSGYLMLGQQLLETHDTSFSSAWNFGPPEAGHLTVGEIVAGFAQHWNALRVELDGGAHPHEAHLLQLNCDKAHTQLNWQPIWSSQQMLERTAAWYRAWYEDGIVRTRADLESYVCCAKAANLAWAGSTVCA